MCLSELWYLNIHFYLRKKQKKHGTTEYLIGINSFICIPILISWSIVFPVHVFKMSLHIYFGSILAAELKSHPFDISFHINELCVYRALFWFIHYIAVSYSYLLWFMWSPRLTYCSPYSRRSEAVHYSPGAQSGGTLQPCPRYIKALLPIH
jgi:hypothetical protein